jgi:D-aspartate ligase
VIDADRTRPPPAILLGGNDNALSIARSLRRRRVPVYALGCGRSVRLSRFARTVGDERDRAGDPAPTLAWLTGRESEPLRDSVLFPCDDDALEMVARNRDLLRERYRLPGGQPALVLAMLDKAQTYERAAEIGVPAPRVWAVDSREELTRILTHVEFPCGLKPRHSHLFRRHFGTRKLFVVNGAEQLVGRFEEMRVHGLEALVTEIVPGPDEGFRGYWTYVDEAGRKLFEFTKEKHRQHPIHFGMGTFHVSRHDPETLDVGRRFVDGTGLRGSAVVEFKRDARDGRLKLIECNARFVAPNELAVRSGLDVPWIVYRHLTGGATEAASDYRDGVRLWFPVQDFQAFLGYRRAKEISTSGWLRSIGLRPRLSHFPCSDPLPVLGWIAHLLLRRVRRVPATLPPEGAALAHSSQPRQR